LGDNLGFWVGRKFGSTFIRWAKKIVRINDLDVEVANDLVRRKGSLSIFFARFIFGFRTVAGPVAGTLGMEWKRFLIANALGAVSWVSMIACLGYLFGSTFDTLLKYFKTAGWAVKVGLFAVAYVIWRWEKRKFKQHHHQHAH